MGLGKHGIHCRLSGTASVEKYIRHLYPAEGGPYQQLTSLASAPPLFYPFSRKTSTDRQTDRPTEQKRHCSFLPNILDFGLFPTQ